MRLVTLHTQRNRGGRSLPSPVLFTQISVRLLVPFAGLPRLCLSRSPSAASLRVALLWIARVSPLLFSLSRLWLYIPGQKVFLQPILVSLFSQISQLSQPACQTRQSVTRSALLLWSP